MRLFGKILNKSLFCVGNKEKEMKNPQLIKIIAQFSIYLEENNLRKTTERIMILEEIYSRNDHFDAEELYMDFQNRNQLISRATIYNTLDLLSDSGFIRRNQFGSNKTRYEKANNFRQHDHLICMDCNKISEFCDPRLQQIQQTVSKTMQFEIHSHDLLLFGKCKKENCENKKIKQN